MFFHEGSTWTVSPGSSTPLRFELLPVWAWASTSTSLRRERPRRDPPDIVGGVLREPEVAVRASGDPVRAAAGRGDRELRDDARRRNPPDLVAVVLREPEVAVRAGGDAVGWLLAVGTANSVTTPAVVIRPILLPIVLREPEVAVRARRDPVGPAAGRENRKLRDDARRRDPADLVACAFR